MTALEVYLIQCHVLSLGTGLPLPQPLQRPDWHPYPTFESHLPLKWSVKECLIEVKSDDLIASLPDNIGEKPEFPCSYCPHAKPYVKVYSLWAHVYYKHPDIDRSDRLDKIRQSAAVMSAYFRDTPKSSGGSRNVLVAKLETAASATFCWEDVTSWRLTR